METNVKENETQILEDELEKDEKDEEAELDEAIDFSLSALPLEATEQKLMSKIIEAPTRAELQTQLELFNINQSKKNALRIVKLSHLLEKVEDQAIERFERRPDQVSNKELLEYMNVISNQIERAQKSVDSLKDIPAISITNQTNELNINVGPKLDKDSKEKVIDVISALLKQVQQKDIETVEVEVIEETKQNDEITDVESIQAQEAVFDELIDEEN